MQIKLARWQELFQCSFSPLDRSESLLPVSQSQSDFEEYLMSKFKTENLISKVILIH